MSLDTYLNRDHREPVSVSLRTSTIARLNKVVDQMQETDPNANRSALVDKILEEKLDAWNIQA